jgi:cytochrome c oxidase cbb3-type subunit 2
VRRGYKYFEAIEKRAALLGILTAVMVSLGGLAEITPIFMAAHAVEAAPGVKPYDPLRLAGKDIYVREGCYVCHSQMIRALRAETQRYGHYSVASESVFDRPHQWGSKRTGPDLARVGGKYSDAWQRLHLLDPRQVVKDSNMPGYPWLEKEAIDADDIVARMRTLRRLGDPYTDADIAAAPEALADKTSLDAVVAYLQGLGINNEPVVAAEATASSAATASSTDAASSADAASSTDAASSAATTRSTATASVTGAAHTEATP